MWGATLAGMAFGNSGTHLPHAMSYGVTHLMRDITTEGYPVASPFVPHGISVMVNAPAIFRFLASGAPQRHLEAAAFLGEDIADAAPEDAGEVVASRIIRLMRDTGAPNGLSGVGFGRDDIRDLAASSIRQTRAIHNAPRVADLGAMEDIYADSISYW
jgi:alcohol dehydrogenase class IV